MPLSAKAPDSRVKSMASLVQPGRIRARIEKQHELFAGVVGKRDGAAAIARQAEGGRLGALAISTDDLPV